VEGELWVTPQRFRRSALSPEADARSRKGQELPLFAAILSLVVLFVAHRSVARCFNIGGVFEYLQFGTDRRAAAPVIAASPLAFELRGTADALGFELQK
jgi:hypothetical protein